MHDFPPVVPDFQDTAAAPPSSSGQAAVAVRPDAPLAPAHRRDFSDPDTRSPGRFLGWLVRQQLGASYGDAIMVGDRLDTDGLFARTLGCRFGLVFTGVTRPDEVVAGQADMVAADLTALADLLLGAVPA